MEELLKSVMELSVDCESGEVVCVATSTPESSNNFLKNVFKQKTYFHVYEATGLRVHVAIG